MNAAIIVFFIVVATIGVLLQVAAPCEFYTFASGADIPGRCLMP